LQLILLKRLNKQQEIVLKLQHQDMAVVSQAIEYHESKAFIEDKHSHF
jgi:hypothetical protein